MINILFGGNEKVYDGIMLCLLSMIKHTDSILNVYILTTNLTEIGKFCKENNILVVNTPNYGNITVAEFALALLLNVTRKVS